MARSRRHFSQVAFEDGEDFDSHFLEKKPGITTLRLLCISLVCFLVLPALFSLSYSAFSQDSTGGENPISQLQQNPAHIGEEKDIAGSRNEENRELEDQTNYQVPDVDRDTNGRAFDLENQSSSSMNQGSSHEDADNGDPLLDGLLAEGFCRDCCRSRHEVYRYRKASKYKPSAYLVERLRKYEDLHRRCGPNTEIFNKSLDQLKSEKVTREGDCQYIVWTTYSGLGNKILTIAATFLYAFLNNRVLLIDKGQDMTDLFCEPFPNSSWFLPSDFPSELLENCNETSIRRYGTLLNNNIVEMYENESLSSLPHYIYLHLTHNYNFYDKLFFCEREQYFLEHIPWLFLKSNSYFVPSLYLLPMFNKELHNLFPDKESVFHHLGRYLFHPSNRVWGLITRFYQSYMAYAKQRIGIQIRTLDPGFFSYISEQALACSVKNGILPDVLLNDEEPEDTYVIGGMKKPYVVLMTSLHSGHFEKVKNMYWEHPTVDGHHVSVYQPSHEEWQQTEKQSHDMKAWAEMYLLSLSDVLITSPMSTFGYVAQGLGGIKPWMLFKPENDTAPDPPCREVMSMEPCFHAPPYYDCQAQQGIDTGEVIPYVRHCEDVSWGLKLVENDEL
eukprot:PITA_13928